MGMEEDKRRRGWETQQRRVRDRGEERQARTGGEGGKGGWGKGLIGYRGI